MSRFQFFRRRRQLLPALLLLMLLSPACNGQQEQANIRRQLARVAQGTQSGPFRADWDSLAAYRIPSWYRDAKFGIFIHWGVYSVPAFGNEWYPRNMYIAGKRRNSNITLPYTGRSRSSATRISSRNFVPSTSIPTRGSDLFARAGARYIVPVAEHCDGFAMYNSSITPWNAVKMGPHRDIVGALATATRRRGLHFGVSSHRAEHWWWYSGGMKFDSDVRDPAYAGLYGPAQPTTLPGENDRRTPTPTTWNAGSRRIQPFLDDWLARSSELVDKYHPDFMYFDWWIGQPAFQPYLKQFAAYYYNQAAARKQGVVLTYKDQDFPANTAVLDIERGKLDALRLLPWQTDTSVSIHSWGYVKDDEYRDAKSLIGELVDVVSKNGNLLLNVGPKADGTIPEQARTILLQMGRWLSTNGEAIYGSRPWLLYGEGPTTVASSALNTDRQEFTPEDIRFTTNNGALYAICAGLAVEWRVARAHALQGNAVSQWASLLSATARANGRARCKPAQRRPAYPVACQAAG